MDREITQPRIGRKRNTLRISTSVCESYAPAENACIPPSPIVTKHLGLGA